MANIIKTTWRRLTGWQSPAYAKQQPMDASEQTALLQFLAKNGAGQEIQSLMRASRGETADALRAWLKDRPKA